MQWQKVTIPIGKGVDESSDARVRSVDVPSKVTNGRFDKSGRIAKRRGFQHVNMLRRATGTGWGDQPARGLYSTGRELVLLGRYGLWSADLSNLRWHERGWISAPGHTKQVGLFDGSGSYSTASMDVAGLTTGQASGFIGIRLNQDSFNETTESHRENAVVLQATLPHGRKGTSAEGDDLRVALSQPAEFDTATASGSKPHAPLMLHQGDTKLIAMWMSGLTAPVEIRRYELNYSSLSAEPTWAALSSPADSNVYYNGENIRTYDAIGLRRPAYDGQYVLARVDNTSGDLTFDRYTNGTSNANSAITTDSPYTRVAICEATTTDHIYVLAASLNVTYKVDLWKLSLSTFAVAWGPINLWSSIGAVPENLGVVETGTRVVAVWGEENSGTDDQVLTRQRSTNLSGGDLESGMVAAYNALPRSKPFVHNGRTYVWLDSTLADTKNTTPPEHHQATYLYEHTTLYDLRVNDEDGPRAEPVMEAVQNVGTSPPWYSSLGVGGSRRAMKQGVGSNVVEFPSGSGVYHCAGVSVAINSGQDNLFDKYKASRVSVDFGDVPIAASPHYGALAIGGGYISWYDGARTTELGFVTAPIIQDWTDPTDVTIGGPTTLPNDTYTYIATTESYDAAGVWHRSVPGAAVKHTKASGDAVRFTIKHTSATNRNPTDSEYDTRPASHVLYRAAADGVFRRISPPMRVVEHNRNMLSDTFHDLGQYLSSSGVGTGTPLYTESGELESVCPNGGRILLKAKERLWLADGARQDLVQYSKRLTPGTATEARVAPEFNEGFSLLIPSGERCTGLAELDDKVVVFTKTRVYIISGRGPADNGTANDFSEMTPIPSDTGCLEARSVVQTPAGVLFRGEAGIYLLNRGLAVQYIGAPVEDTTTTYPVVTSSVLVAQDNEIRFTCIEGTDAGADAGVVVVYNYDVGQWSVWEITDGAGGLKAFVGACMHGDVYYACTSTGELWAELGTGHAFDNAVYSETQTHYDWHAAGGSHPTGTTYVPLVVETGWLAPAQPQGWSRVRYAIPLLESLDTCDIKVSLFHDYNATADNDHTWDAATLGALVEYPRVQPKFHVVRQKCEAIKIRIEDAEDGNTTTGEGFTIAAVSLELGVKRGMVNAAPIQRN